MLVYLPAIGPGCWRKILRILPATPVAGSHTDVPIMGRVKSPVPTLFIQQPVPKFPKEIPNFLNDSMI